LTKLSTPQDAPSDASSPRVNSFSTAYHSPADRAAPRDLFGPEPKRVKYTEAHQPPYAPESILALPASPESVEYLRKQLPATDLQANSLGFDLDANFISHSAVLAENELSVGIQSLNSGAMPMSKATQMQIDRGAAVLTLLKDLPAIEKYIDK
jgi:hypothetical protein